MKRLLLILILTLSFQSWTKADDIRDFQIEGMSIGDSALDYFSINDIIKNSQSYYKNKKFTPVQNDKYDFFKTYDAVDYHFKTGDNKYIIQSISGILFYDKNIEQCYKKMNSIIADIDKNFDYIKKYPKVINKHRGDKTGKSKYTEITYKLEEGYIVVICYDYSIEDGGQDHLALSIDTNELNKFLASDIYK